MKKAPSEKSWYETKIEITMSSECCGWRARCKYCVFLWLDDATDRKGLEIEISKEFYDMADSWHFQTGCVHKGPFYIHLENITSIVKVPRRGIDYMIF